jgi:hypothetical protein
MGLGCILSGEKERGISDHSPTLISVARFVSYGPKPFKFFNFWANHNYFLDWIKDAWRFDTEGYSMFRFYAKLKVVKDVLKKKNKEVYGGLGQKVSKARQDLVMAQPNLSLPEVILIVEGRKKSVCTC